MFDEQCLYFKRQRFFTFSLTMGDSYELYGRKPTVSTLQRTSSLYSKVTHRTTVALTATENESKEDVKWFDDHRLVVLSLAIVIAIVVIIIIICCYRHCCKRDKKQSKGKTHGKGTSVAHQDFEMPRSKKSSVQPQPAIKRQQNIRELGKLEFSLKYDYERSQLNVNVIRGENFPLISSSNVSFTYVVVELRPFSQKYEAKAQTRYVRNSVSPVFNDVINYQIQAKDLEDQTLCLSVFDINHLSAHDLIGCVKLKVVGKKIATGLKRSFKESLTWEDDEEASQQIGEILVGLRWNREDEILELAIQEAANLRKIDTDKQTSNPYVKIQVFVNSFLIFKKRTKVEKRNINPKFKKKFDVHVPSECLAQNTQIILTVKHAAKFRKKEVIGQLYLAGIEGKETVSEHWRVMKKGGNYEEMWHELDLSINKSLLRSDSKTKYLLFDDDQSGDDTSAESDARSGFGSFDGSIDHENSL